MKHVKATELPSHSVLLERVGHYDFIDCYCVASALKPRQAAEVITDFPQWACWLISIRNGLTKPFGLSSDPVAADKVGFFPVESDNEHELIAGFNDKHLDFRVSVMSHQGQVFLATWVHPHNVAGAIYLNVILPFHKLIAKDALARVRFQGMSYSNKHINF